MGSQNSQPDQDPGETRDESTESESNTPADQSAGQHGGLPLSRRATLASLAGIGGLSLASSTASAKKVKTWNKDRDADGNTLFDLGALAMRDNTTEISDFAGANLAIESNVLNADTWDTDVDAGRNKLVNIGALRMEANGIEIKDFTGDNSRLTPTTSSTPRGHSGRTRSQMASWKHRASMASMSSW